MKSCIVPASFVRLKDLCQCLMIASLLSTSVPSRSRRTPAKVCLSIGAVNAGCLLSEDMMSCFLKKWRGSCRSQNVPMYVTTYSIEKIKESEFLGSLLMAFGNINNLAAYMVWWIGVLSKATKDITFATKSTYVLYIDLKLGKLNREILTN